MAGSYSAKLKATSGFGCVDSVVNSFVINPQAQLSLTVLDEFCRDTAMQFNGGVINGVSINKWLWDFGDHAIDSIQNPKHIYINADTFSVSLNAITSEGCRTDTTIKNVIINPLPVAAFGFVGLSCRDQQIVFSDSSKPSIGNITSQAWTFWRWGPCRRICYDTCVQQRRNIPREFVGKNSKGCNSRLLTKMWS